MKNERKDVLSYALFDGMYGEYMWLLSVRSTDGEEAIKRAARKVNDAGGGEGLGEFIEILNQEYVDDGNGSFRRAQQQICERALVIFFARFGVPGMTQYLEGEILGRNLVLIRKKS